MAVRYIIIAVLILGTGMASLYFGINRPPFRQEAQHEQHQQQETPHKHQAFLNNSQINS